MIFFLLSLNILIGSAVSQACGQAGQSGILSLATQEESACHFLGKLTNPAIPCKGSCAQCDNNQAHRVLRASGDWSVDAGSVKEWDAAEPLGLLIFDEQKCIYTLAIAGLKPSKSYKWKVTVDNAWNLNFGCAGSGDCVFTASSEGAVRLIVKPQTGNPQLTHDFNLGVCGDGVCEIGESCEFCPEDCGTCAPTTTGPPTTTIPFVTSNPIKPCDSDKCPVCANNLASKLLRVTGSWAGSAVWNAAQPNGLLTYDLNTCEYYLVILDLAPKTEFAWKVTVNNAWVENYGCGGDCKFTSNSQGAVRFIVKPTGGVPKLSTDYNVAECGDDICEVGESCEFCPEDCGTCPPPVCGGKSFLI